MSRLGLFVIPPAIWRGWCVVQVGPLVASPWGVHQHCRKALQCSENLKLGSSRSDRPPPDTKIELVNPSLIGLCCVQLSTVWPRRITPRGLVLNRTTDDGLWKAETTLLFRFEVYKVYFDPFAQLCTDESLDSLLGFSL